MDRYVCAICGTSWKKSWSGVCRGTYKGRFCGSEVREPVMDALARQEGAVTVRPLEKNTLLRPIDFHSQLSQALGGVCLGHLILLAGAPGSGKSTLAAELASQIATRTRGAVWWMDREQSSHALISAAFERTRSRSDAVHVVSQNPSVRRSITWREALQKIIDGAEEIVVCDSLQAWCDYKEMEARAFLSALRSTKSTKIVISHVNSEGDPFGATTMQHLADAVAMISIDEIRIPQKCRWSVTPRAFNRATGKSTVG